MNEDMNLIHQQLAFQSSKEPPGSDHRNDVGWILFGKDAISQSLECRPSHIASDYCCLHPITLPSYPQLDALPLSDVDTHMSAPDTADTHPSAEAPAGMEVEGSQTNPSSSTLEPGGTEQGDGTPGPTTKPNS
jgi:hypothetical protein